MENQLVLLIHRESSIPGRLELARQLKDLFSKEGCRYNAAFVDFESLLAGLANWTESSSPSVSVAGMEIVGLLVGGMKEDFHPYLKIVLPPVISKLGDQKKLTREAAQILILEFMDQSVETPEYLLDTMVENCTSKNWRAREQVLICLVKSLSRFGKSKVHIRRYLKMVCEMTKAAHGNVRSAAMDTLVNMYQCVGRELLAEISKFKIDASKMEALKMKIDRIERTRKQGSITEDQFCINGVMFSGTDRCSNTRDSIGSTASNNSVFARPIQLERTHPVANPPPHYSVNQRRSSTMTYKVTCDTSSSRSDSESVEVGSSNDWKGDSTKSYMESRRRKTFPCTVTSPLNNSTRNSGPKLQTQAKSISSFSRDEPDLISSAASSSCVVSGTLCEEDFLRIFSRVIATKIAGIQKFEFKFKEICEVLKDKKSDWHAKLRAIQNIRKLVHFLLQSTNSPEFSSMMNDLTDLMITSFKNHRSQVVKEICVTVGYICHTLGCSATLFGKDLLPHLLSLLSNSTKIISSSGDICIRFVIKDSLSSALLRAFIKEGFSSKSLHIRRYCAGYLSSCIHHIKDIGSNDGIPLMEHLLKLAIEDFDSLTRKQGRRAFWDYESQFPSNAKTIMEKLSCKEQKYVLAQKPAEKETKGPKNDDRSKEDPLIKMETSQVQPDGDISKSLNQKTREKNFRISIHDSKPEVEFVADDKAATVDPPSIMKRTRKVPRKLETVTSPPLQEMECSVADFNNNENDSMTRTLSVGCQSCTFNVEIDDTRSLVLKATEQLGKFKHSCDLLTEGLRNLTEEVHLTQCALQHCTSKLIVEKPQNISEDQHHCSVQPREQPSHPIVNDGTDSSADNSLSQSTDPPWDSHHRCCSFVPDEIPSVLGWTGFDQTVPCITQETVGNNSAAMGGMVLSSPSSSSYSTTLESNPPEGSLDLVDLHVP